MKLKSVSMFGDEPDGPSVPIKCLNLVSVAIEVTLLPRLAKTTTTT